MRVNIGTDTVTLRVDDLLGHGGEACVYRAGDRAVKIYHERNARALKPRLDKLRSFPTDLPTQVIRPESFVTTPKGKVIGYTMRLLEGAEDFSRLGRRPYRDGVISNAEVIRMFRKVHALLIDLHDRDIVVGDLNDANLMFTPDHQVWLIDTDSMQLGGHACPVAHERFLDPRLFGADLAATPCFTPESDWYAFSVMLFNSLLYLHPFGGVHPKLTTLTRRAAAGHSVLRGDVRLPRISESANILPGALRTWFARVFDQGLRDIFPARLLDATWHRCQCGVEHARAACPHCAAAGVLSPPPPIERRGRCRLAPIRHTTGRILTATIQGSLRYLYVEDGVIRRENGTAVMEQQLLPGMRFGIAGRSSFVGRGDRVVEIRDGKLRARYNTGTFAHTPAFATHALGAVITRGPWLMRADGVRLGSVLEGQTWLALGEELGYGFYRAGGLTVQFLFDPMRPGITQLELPHMNGRLLDIDVVFDERHALINYTTEIDGRAETALHLVRKGGDVRASIVGHPDSSPLLAEVGGKAVLGGQVVAATDAGLMRVEVESDLGVLVPGQVFVDTEDSITAGTPILPGPGGSIYTLAPRRITQIIIEKN